MDDIRIGGALHPSGVCVGLRTWPERFATCLENVMGIFFQALRAMYFESSAQLATNHYLAY